MAPQSPNENAPEEPGKAEHNDGENASSKPVVRWATLASIVAAPILAALSVMHDCTGVAYNSEQCLWSRSLYLLTAGIYFVFTWPVMLVIVAAIWGKREA
jgi:hypothetical protein